MSHRYNKRRPEHDAHINSIAAELWRIAYPVYENLRPQGFCVEQRCGRASQTRNEFTIPWWVMVEKFKAAGKPGYLIWYIAHELAHIAAPENANHGPLFMAELRKICPSEFQHYELGYKPRNAAKAGISNP